MAYSSGILNERITIAQPVENSAQDFLKAAQRYQITGHYWASVSFARGTKALREGALDAYDTRMFRIRHHDGITRRCIIRHNGKWHQTLSLNADRAGNQIQILAAELADQNIEIVQNRQK